MKDMHPQYITDTAGKKLAILPSKEFDTLMDELEELEDIKLYDQAKKEDDGKRILFDDYLKQRKKNNT